VDFSGPTIRKGLGKRAREPDPGAPGDEQPAASTDRTTKVLETLAGIQAKQTKVLSRLQRKRGHDEREEDTSSSEDSQDGRFGGRSKLRRIVMRETDRYVGDWLEHVQGEMAADAGNPWSLALYSQKLRPSFAKNTSLYRVHHMLSEALDVALVNRKPKQCIAMCIGLSQAIHQAAVDNGRWTLADELVIMRDPLAPVEFAGIPKHLHMVMSRQEAMLKLRAKMRTNKAGGKGLGKGDAEDEEGAHQPATAPQRGGQQGPRRGKKDEER